MPCGIARGDPLGLLALQGLPVARLGILGVVVGHVLHVPGARVELRGAEQGQELDSGNNLAVLEVVGLPSGGRPLRFSDIVITTGPGVDDVFAAEVNLVAEV